MADLSKTNKTMKRYICILFFLCVLANLHAQHISFLGFQLGQTKEITDRLLRQNGFEYSGWSRYDNDYLYNGDFWIYCETRLRVTVEGGLVTAIQIEIPKEKYNKMADFNKLLNNLNSKYGKIYSKESISKYFYFYYWKVKGGYVMASYFKKSDFEDDIGFSLSYIDCTNKTYKKPIVTKKRNKNNDL